MIKIEIYDWGSALVRFTWYTIYLRVKVTKKYRGDEAPYDEHPDKQHEGFSIPNMKNTRSVIKMKAVLVEKLNKGKKRE